MTSNRKKDHQSHCGCGLEVAIGRRLCCGEAGRASCWCHGRAGQLLAPELTSDDPAPPLRLLLLRPFRDDASLCRHIAAALCPAARPLLPPHRPLPPSPAGCTSPRTQRQRAPSRCHHAGVQPCYHGFTFRPSSVAPCGLTHWGKPIC